MKCNARGVAAFLAGWRCAYTAYDSPNVALFTQFPL